MDCSALTNLGRIPRLAHAPGSRSHLRKWAAECKAGGDGPVVFVTGRDSLRRRGFEAPLLDALRGTGMPVTVLRVAGEPSDGWVDAARDALREGSPPVLVVAAGGGSALDAGKALAAMLTEPEPTVEYLEGVGHRPPSGSCLPWIALPTTAGTGSEATHNAVLGRVGEAGFKRSLRHAAYKASAVILDAELAIGCPPQTTAACGMDALTQLLESYLSPLSPPLLDRWLEWGIELAARSLSAVRAGMHTRPETACRHDLAMAAFLSGVGLAHSNLGTVHGFAGPLGARVAVPHGVVCGTLLAPCLRETVAWLEADGSNGAALGKLARAGRILAGAQTAAGEPAPTRMSERESRRHLVETISGWTERMRFPPLRDYGVDEAVAAVVLPSVSNRKNPAQLTPETLRDILHERM